MSDFDSKLFLVGVGAQKAGTTWLARYLGEHPDVYVSRLKELHYFDAVCPTPSRVDVGKRMIRLAKEVSAGLELNGSRVNVKAMDKLLAVIDRLQMQADPKYPYMRFFHDRVKEESVFCDITPGYSLLDASGYQSILKMHPRVRFIFLMRDPIERYWSALRMGVRKMKNFDPDRRFMDLLEDKDYFFRSDYKRTIEELEKVAKPEQIKYVFYENLFTDETAAQITSFIGVTPLPAKFDQIVNPGAKIPLAADKLTAAYGTFRHIYDFVFEKFGKSVPASWHATVKLASPGS
ncbi:MAG: hypothetical protein JWQ90_4969 [Hydrocarboniphaga sp.]|uniref:sulfotransferase family protein n=1 Tax=Hydrocarboniphaga sp. TaxID=2033016 RepID=UPI00262D157D|nr:sulfotransferase [Hydrocarboniphaga sp.]MDB5972519.1 hypothetical protein [Hydrocarboniphaga sp.]